MVYSLQIPTGWKKTINISPDKRKAREHIDSEHTSVDWPKQFSCTEWKHKRWSRRDGRWVRKRMNLRREASLCEKLFESWDKVETLCVASSSIAFLLWQFGQQHGKPWEPVLRAEGSRLCPARFCWALSVSVLSSAVGIYLQILEATKDRSNIIYCFGSCLEYLSGNYHAAQHCLTSGKYLFDHWLFCLNPKWNVRLIRL